MNHRIKLLTLTGLCLFITSWLSAQTANLSNATLKECINYGLENHPTIRLYENAVDKAKHSAREALSGYLPQVGVQSTWDYNYKLQENVIPAGVFGPQETRLKIGSKFASNSIIQLDQVLYDQSLLVGLKAAKPNKRLAELDRMSNDEQIIYNISKSYYSILVAKEQKALLQDNLQKLKELLRITKLQEKHGVINSVDVAQVAVNLKNIEAQLNLIDDNIALALNSLKNAMGVPYKEPLSIASSLDNDASRQQAPPKLEAFNYQNTIAFMKQQAALDLWDINIERIKYSALPKIGLYARYGVNGFDNKKPLKAYDPLLDFGTVGVKLTWGIFTGFRRDAIYRTAIIDRENTQLQMDINSDLMQLSYQNAVTDWYNKRNAMGITRENINLAKEVFEKTELRYKAGTGTLTQLINAEMSLRSANNNYTQNLVDYYKSVLEIHKAQGTLKEFVNNL